MSAYSSSISPAFMHNKPQAKAAPNPYDHGFKYGLNQIKLASRQFIFRATSCLLSHRVHAISQQQPVRKE